jgi:hypothetical protein
MQATKMLQEQLKWINGSFHAIVDDITDEEWTARLLPGMNLPGYSLWHAARVPDVDVQTVLRGVPEVIWQARWASRGALTTPGFGLDVTLAEADAIAHGTRPADVSAYADAVLAEVVGWLDTLSDADLDRVTENWQVHLTGHPEYQVPGLLEQYTVGPIWEEVLGTCGFHCRGHLTEVALIKQRLRQAAATLPETATALAVPEPVVAAVSAARPALRRWPWSRK